MDADQRARTMRLRDRIHDPRLRDAPDELSDVLERFVAAARRSPWDEFNAEAEQLLREVVLRLTAYEWELGH